MTLTYEFGGNEYEFGEEFEYDLELSQLYEYFRAIGREQLIQYLEEEFNCMTEANQSEILTDLINDNDPTLLKKIKEGTDIKFIPNFEQLLDDDEEWCIDTFIIDNNLNYYEDELKEYFEDDAYEAYKEEIENYAGQKQIEREYWADIRSGLR